MVLGGEAGGWGEDLVEVSTIMDMGVMGEGAGEAL